MAIKTVYFCDQNIIGMIKQHNQHKELNKNSKKIINTIKFNDNSGVMFSFMMPSIECDQRNLPNLASIQNYNQKDLEHIIEFSKQNLKKAKTDCQFIKHYFEHEIFFKQELNNKKYLNFLKSIEPKLVNETSNDKTFYLCEEIIEKAKEYNINFKHPVVMTCILIACKYDNTISNKEKKIKNVIKPGIGFNAYNALQDIMFIVRTLIIRSMFMRERYKQRGFNVPKFYILTADKKLRQLSTIFQWTPSQIPNSALYIPYQEYIAYKPLPRKYFPSLLVNKDNTEDKYNDLQNLLTSLSIL